MTTQAASGIHSSSQLSHAKQIRFVHMGYTWGTHGIHMGYTRDTQQLTAEQHPDAFQNSEQQLTAELLDCGSCEVALCIFSAMTIQAACEVHSSSCHMQSRSANARHQSVLGFSNAACLTNTKQTGHRSAAHRCAIVLASKSCSHSCMPM